MRYSLLEEESDIDFEPVIVDATITDDTGKPGVYLVEVTLYRAGRYALEILFRGLETPTSLTDGVLCVPTLETIALTSNFTGVSEPYLTG